MGSFNARDTGPTRWTDRTFGRLGFYQIVRPLVVGIVHGPAGSAAVALLVLTTILVPSWAVFYLLVFGIGTVTGMMPNLVFRKPLCAPPSRLGTGFRTAQSGLRRIHCSSNGFRERPLHAQSCLDATLTF